MPNKITIRSLFESTQPKMELSIQDFSSILHTELNKHLEQGISIAGNIQFPCRTVCTGYGMAERDTHLCDYVNVPLRFSPKDDQHSHICTTLTLSTDQIASYVKQYFVDSFSISTQVDLKIEFVVGNLADDRFGGSSFDVTKVVISFENS